MPSIVELIFSAIGAKESAAAAAEVAARLKELRDAAKEALGSGIVSDVTKTQAALKSYSAQVSSASAQHANLGVSLQNTSATIRDALIPHLDRGTEQLLGMAAAAFSLREIYVGFREAIGDGADLEHLSQRTGETVKNLVIEQQAFENSGLGAQFLGTAINLVDRALSVTAPNAKRNEQLFRELGVSMTELRSEDFAGKIAILGAAFEKLPNQAERAQLAMQLFGRYSGGQMLQLFSDPQAMALATEQAGRLGERMQQDAAAFAEVENHLRIVTLRLKEMFVAGAEEVLPTLESIARAASAINLSGLGTVLGAAGPTAVGGLVALWGIDKLDAALLNTAEKFQGTIRGAMASAAAESTGLLATALPYGLAAAISLQIVAGIMQAYEDSQIQRLRRGEKMVQDNVEPFRKAAGKETTQEQAQQILADSQATLQKLIDERTALKAKDTGSAPNAAVATIEAVREVFGGKEARRGLSADDQERLSGLDASITSLSAEIKNRFANPAAVANQLSANQLAAMKEALAPLVQQLPTLQEKHDKLMLEAMTPEQRVSALQRSRAPLEQQLASINPALDEESKTAQRLSLENQIAELKKEEAAAQKEVDSAAKKSLEDKVRLEVYVLETQMEQAKASGNDELAESLKEQIQLKRASLELTGQELASAIQRVHAEHAIWTEQKAQRDATKAVAAERIALENTLNAIRENLSSIESDYARTDAEKWQAKKDELLKEIVALQAQVDADNKAAADAKASGDTGAAATYEQSAAAKGKELASARGSLARVGPDPDSINAQLTAQMTGLENSMGTVAQQIGKTWASMGDSMRSSLSTAFYDMLAHSKTFGQGAAAVWLSIRQSAAQSVSNMAADYLMKHIIMDNARRLFHAMGLIEEKASTTAEVATHGAGEAAKTGATAAGATTRTGIRLVETVTHGIMVGIRTAIHIAGEIMQTTVTITQSGIRIAATIAESLVSIIKAAAGAMSAMASIPYVGPILAIAAAAAMIAEGSSLLKGARESGGPVEAGSAYLVGEKRPEIFVPQSNGYIFPDAAAFSAPAARGVAPATFAGSPAGTASGRGQSAGGGGPRHENHYWFIDRSAMNRAMASDMYAIAHEVTDKKLRG